MYFPGFAIILCIAAFFGDIVIFRIEFVIPCTVFESEAILFICLLVLYNNIIFYFIVVLRVFEFFESKLRFALLMTHIFYAAAAAARG